MQPHQERVVVEKHELDEKLDKLGACSKSESNISRHDDIGGANGCAPGGRRGLDYSRIRRGR
jgi:hypothetical protein